MLDIFHEVETATKKKTERIMKKKLHMTPYYLLLLLLHRIRNQIIYYNTHYITRSTGLKISYSA